MSHTRGDIVKVPISYDDDPGRFKDRAALVISIPAYETATNALIVAKITGTPCKTLIDYEVKDWKAAGLTKPSWVRIKLFTVSANLVTSKYGQLGDVDFAEVIKLLRISLDLN